MGCAGFFLYQDDLESSLIDSNVLPQAAYDVPMAIADRAFNADGTMYYDFLDHDGMLGDTFIVNGAVQPRFVVERRKYRFRILCASNARVFTLRLSTGQPFLQVGNDAWLLPFAMLRPELLLTPAKRADVIIDFTNAPEEVFLENWMLQDDGRKPDGIADRPTPLVKFVVQGAPARNDATVDVNTPLRPHIPILPEEIEFTRAFNFGRSQGVWTVNNELYDGQRVDAAPRLGSAERWILRNSSGGWWHPIHMHLESHQIQRVNGRAPDPWDRFKVDTSILEDGTEIEVFMRFRTFQGPFVFHCHNLEHEDMRMMSVFDPRPQRVATPAPVVRWYP
jgi:FtsP/CotA-like multicopper oxidase with cupredoxin domain